VVSLQYAVWVYVAGVVWGLLMIDERPIARAGLALLWPLGPVAFVITFLILLAASTIAFPVLGVALLGVLLLVAAWTLL
jgi:hypothetical protein